MSCEYELRCVNSDKCYRCFDQSLLKLPEDKIKNKYKKTKITSFKEKTSKDSWKDLEEEVSIKLNKVPTMQEARRTLASGALWFEKGDVKDSILHVECKERQGTELKGGDKSISIKKSWLDKAKNECTGTNKFMCLPFRFKSDDTIYCVMDFDNIIELVTLMKTYIQDNEMKSKEIELLKKKYNTR